MAHSLGSTILARSSAATSPITRSATTAAGDTCLVLMLNIVGATNRAGTAPTFNGVAGIQANSTQKAATTPEASAELWYWVGGIPPGTTGGLFIGTADIVIPNTGSATIFSAAYTGRAATGFTSLFNAAAGSNNTAANPTTGSIAGTIAGDIIFATTAGGWQAFAPSARTGTSLYETDDGANGGGGQYLLQGGSGAQAMTWTQASDDWGAVGAAFKEVPLLTPPVGTLTLTGQVLALGFALGMSVGSLALSGFAPTATVGSGAIDMTPAPAALTLTGHAPIVSNTLFIPIPSGSLVFKGPARVSSGTSIEIPAGSLSLSGQTPSVNRTYVADIGAGTLSVSGLAPTILVGQRIEIGAGSLQFKGPARSGAISASPAVGALAFTGYAPSVVNNQPIAIGAGSLAFDGQYVGIAFGGLDTATLTLTGYAPTASVAGGSNTNISPDVAALALTGYAPAATVNHIAAPAVGALTLQGTISSLSAGVGIPAGTLTLTGHAPSLALTFPIGAGSLALTGLAPSTPAAGTYEPGVGSLTLAGYAPSVNVSYQISVGVGTLTLAGHAPNINGGNTITPGAGSLTFSGHAPTLRYTLEIPIASGTLALTGTAPTLGQSYVFTPNAGALTFAGRVPTFSMASAVEAVDASREWGVEDRLTTWTADGRLSTWTVGQRLTTWTVD
jgi:hypothetical protein